VAVVPERMNSFSPIGTGFQVAFRRPSLTLAEIAWRWCFAAAAWVLAGALIFEYLHSLSVGQVERFLLHTGQPFLVWRVLRNVFSGSLLRFTEAAILTALGLTIAWILLASIGRLVVVGGIADELGVSESSPRKGILRVLFSLNFLRAALLLATKLSALGAILVASSLWASTHISVGDAARMWFLLWFVIAGMWVALDWLLATSAVLTVTEANPAHSFLPVVQMLHQNPGAVIATVVCFGILQILGIAALCGATLSVFAALGSHPVAFFFLEFMLVLAYSVVSDFLHVASMVAYVRILKGEEPVLARLTGIQSGPRGYGEAIDRDELILSDLPLATI
jgi:hypothetical protein